MHMTFGTGELAAGSIAGLIGFAAGGFAAWRAAAAQIRAARDESAQWRERLDHAGRERAALEGERKALQVLLDAERRSAAEKLQLLADAKEALIHQFKALANDILEEKSTRFTEQNRVNLAGLLDPLRARIGEFQSKVEEVYVQEGKDRSALAEQLRQLVALNQTLSADAKNLTSALKGSSKTQGAWGEYILERVLEASGLRKGFEYAAQASEVTADGRRLQPDVVIELPGGRKLVVDAKVSLVAYDRYAAAETEAERKAAIAEHLDSVRGHLRSLAAKDYQLLHGAGGIDFVLMFVPIEPAFLLAVDADAELFLDAWQRNVLLVSPSTLLFVVRTVAHLWRQEQQNRNAQEIARRGAELYDKLAGFVDDLRLVGDRLAAAQNAYASAERKLVSGRGNAIRQAEMLRDLGIKPTKRIAPQAVDTALANGASPADEA